MNNKTYWAAFDIANRPSRGRSHQERLRRFIEEVSRIASTAVWNETPNFIMFDSREDIDAIKDRFKSAIDDDIDLLVLVSTLSKAGRVVGVNRDADLFKLMGSIETG
jgi:hypothetical protein